jgi:hypothetical protein
MAVNLTLPPGQALVEQSFQRALDAEIPLLDIPNIAVTCFADRVGSTLLRGTIGRPTFAVCSGVIGQWIIGSHLLVRFWWFFWLRQRVKPTTSRSSLAVIGGSPP